MGLPHLINPNKHMHGHNVVTSTNIELTFSVVVVESDHVLFGVEPRVQTGMRDSEVRIKKTYLSIIVCGLHKYELGETRRDRA